MTATEFAPDATCTRGQSVTFLHRTLKGTASGSANFTDVKSDAFYADAVNWAVANNVTNGTSNTTFSPNADCTRGDRDVPVSRLSGQVNPTEKSGGSSEPLLFCAALTSAPALGIL